MAARAPGSAGAARVASRRRRRAASAAFQQAESRNCSRGNLSATRGTRGGGGGAHDEDPGQLPGAAVVGVGDDGDVEAGGGDREGEEGEAGEGEELEGEGGGGCVWLRGRRGRLRRREGLGVDVEGLLLEDDVGGGLGVRGGVAAARRHGLDRCEVAVHTIAVLVSSGKGRTLEDITSLNVVHPADYRYKVIPVTHVWELI